MMLWLRRARIVCPQADLVSCLRLVGGVMPDAFAKNYRNMWIISMEEQGNSELLTSSAAALLE